MRQLTEGNTQNAYPTHAGPMRIKAVPPKAEAARKTMNEAKLGASAVARLSRKNITDEAKDTYMQC